MVLKYKELANVQERILEDLYLGDYNEKSSLKDVIEEFRESHIKGKYPSKVIEMIAQFFPKASNLFSDTNKFNDSLFSVKLKTTGDYSDLVRFYYNAINELLEEFKGDLDALVISECLALEFVDILIYSLDNFDSNSELLSYLEQINFDITTETHQFYTNDKITYCVLHTNLIYFIDSEFNDQLERLDQAVLSESYTKCFLWVNVNNKVRLYRFKNWEHLKNKIS